MRDGAEKSFIGGRIDLPTEKTSREIARDIPAAIRARAFFSARLADAHLLEQFRRVSDAYSSGEIGRDEARNLLLRYAREAGRDDGTRSLRNLASTARLDLILDQNAKMARAVGQYEAMHRPANMKMFPYVIYRASVGSKSPRDSHKRYDGMVIDKRDPWLRTHWPPWEFGCNCDLQNCTAKKAETLGTVKPMSDPEDVKIESESGFSFDPAEGMQLLPELKEPRKFCTLMEQTMRAVPESSGELLHCTTNCKRYIEAKAETLDTASKTRKMKDGLKAGKTREQCEAEARAAVQKEIMDATDDYVKTLTKDELAPMHRYTDKDAGKANAALRGDVPMTPERKAEILAFSGLLEKGPKYSGICYRGCSFNSPDDAYEYAMRLIGSPETLVGFTSLSPDFETAFYYANKDDKRPGKVIVVVPNSTHGVYWGPHSSQPRDHETTLDYKVYLKGLAFCRKDDTLYVVAEEVFDGTRAL